jgi:hypothetical protein
MLCIKWKFLSQLFDTFSKARISLDGLFVCAGSGFDCKVFREICQREGIFPGVAFNCRNGNNSSDEYYLLDETLYKERFTVERTNAWQDSFRSILNRFDFTASSREAFSCIAFSVILSKKIKHTKKSK